VRSVTLKRPFTGGIVTDVPAHELAPSLSPYAQDGYSPSGVFRQRGGWEYYGAAQVVAADLKGIYRAGFALADVNRDVAITTNSAYIHNGGSAGSVITSLGSTLLPRAVYRDELLLCSQDGLTPLIRYSGSNSTAAISLSGTQSFANAGEPVVTFGGGGTFSANPGPAAYFMPDYTTAARDLPRWYRILESSTTSASIENATASGSETLQNGASLVGAYGFAFPAVSIYSAGAMTYDQASFVITGYGTMWDTGTLSLITGNANGPDALLALPTGADAAMFKFGTVASDTSLTVVTAGTGTSSITTRSPYQIMRRLPFKDVAAHKGSLWGTGNVYYPNRVYVGPPGWDISGPPGETLPYNLTRTWTASNANDFLMDFIDVPASTDGDHNVAILQSPNPLLVLKRRAVYGVYGSFPTFTVEMVADGIGCIDIRSAQSYDEGQFWCGETGIFWYRGGQVTDLTAGRINREWRELTRDFDYGTSDYCSLAVVQGHLIVHITTNGGNTQRTYLCDLSDGSWQSRVSNFTPRYMHTSRLPGEAEKCLAVSDARQGRVLDFAPALDGSGTAKDDAGTAPRLIAYTPEGIDGTSIDDDTRMIDLAVHANVYDVGAAGSTSMTVSAVTQDALTAGATATKNLSDIDSDTVDRIDRHYFRNVNRRGRRHQVRLEIDTLGTDASTTKVEVHQIDAAFRETRNRS
jgi:hypothetical protein